LEELYPAAVILQTHLRFTIRPAGPGTCCSVLWHQERIANTYHDFKDIEGFTKVASLEEIHANDGNLSTPLYVHSINIYPKIAPAAIPGGGESAPKGYAASSIISG
jgi:hypothetical protein